MVSMGNFAVSNSMVAPLMPKIVYVTYQKLQISLTLPEYEHSPTAGPKMYAHSYKTFTSSRNLCDECGRLPCILSSVREMCRENEVAVLADIICRMANDLGLCGRYSSNGRAIIFKAIMLAIHLDSPSNWVPLGKRRDEPGSPKIKAAAT
jgi:hypothetical protein